MSNVPSISSPSPSSSTSPLPLRGKTALVTGVSRRRGIGFAVASHLASLGADVFFHHYSPHDAGQPWGSDDLASVRAALRDAAAPETQLGDLSLDLGLPDAPARLIEAATSLSGRLDIVVCNQARSGADGSIFDMTAEKLDGHWQVNARATLLLTAEFARRALDRDAQPSDPSSPRTAAATPTAPAQPGQRLHRTGPADERSGRRVFWMTSGQHQDSMPGEVAYAGSKSVLAGLTRTVAKELLDAGIVLNTINPGPVNTGYLDPETTDRSVEQTAAMLGETPFGRFGEPEDVARLIAWLSTDAGRWVVGRVLVSDGGFSL